MKTAFEEPQKSAQLGIVGSSTQSEELSLAEFNRVHGAELRRAATAKSQYRSRQIMNRVFESAGILLVVSTVAASFISLFTMLAH